MGWLSKPISHDQEAKPMQHRHPVMGNGLARLITRKWTTFHHDPLGSLRNQVSRIIPWLLRGWAGHQLRQHGALDVLLTFHAARPSGANFADLTDLWFLYRMIRQRKPRTLLEFGSGCSTVILAQALWNNQCHSADRGGYLYSIDADPYWADATAKAMPAHL